MKSTLKIIKLNNTWAKMMTNDSSLEEKIRKNFSIRVPNYRFMPTYKAGVWDGKIKFIDFSGKFYIGLVSKLLKFIERENVEIEIDDKLEKKFDSEFIKKNFKKVLTEDLNQKFAPYDHQIRGAMKAIKHNRGILLHCTGCHEKGHEILMYNGLYKKVEDVIVGDKLMGPDSKKRIVKELHNGKETMYRITPNKGNSFIVNENHILHLYKCKSSNIIKTEFHKAGEVDISVKDYINKSLNFKHRTKLLRTSCIEFNKKTQSIPPYILGILIGDGCLSHQTVSLCNQDDEIINEFIKYSNNIKHPYRITEQNNCFNIFIKNKNKKHNSNELKNNLIKLGLFPSNSNTKFIPENYKICSKKQRLEILAGLLDTDGCFLKNCFEYCSKSKQLAEDVKWIAQSLGFHAAISKRIKTCQIKDFKGTYYNVYISGDLSIVPCRTKRKNNNYKNETINVLATGFSVEKLEVGEYFGFEIDKDKLYIDKDFLIHHNSGKSIMLAMICMFYLRVVKVPKILVLVPSVDLVEQLHENFVEAGIPIEKVGRYYASIKDVKQEIIISTWQSIHSKTKLLKGFNILLGDEVHKLAANVIRKVFDRATNANIRIGCTGTLPEEMTDTLLVQGGTGPVIDVVTTKQMIELGTISDVNINILKMNYEKSIVDELSEGDYFNEREYISNSLPRLNVIKNICKEYLDKGENVIFLSNRIHQMNTLKDILDANGLNNLTIRGDVKVKQRTQIRHAMENKEGLVLIGSVGCVATGLSINKLHAMIIEGGKSKIQTIQSIGRLLRKHKSKEIAQIYDIAENFKYSETHHKRRIKHYKDHELNYQIKEIDVKQEDFQE